jgi:hypothetical protein
VLRFCVDGGGMVVVALRRGLVDLVASTARGHRTRVSGPGARVERQRRRVSGGLLVRGGRVVYGVGAGRVRFVAIVRPAVARSPRALARALAAAGLVRARRGAGTP